MNTRPSGLSLPLRIDPATGGWATSTGDAKIRENLVYLILTAVGERPMRRGFGGGVEALLHDPHDATLHSLLRYQISKAFAEGEPKVILRNLQIVENPEEPGGHSVLVVLDYTLRDTRESSRIAVPVNLGARP